MHEIRLVFFLLVNGLALGRLFIETRIESEGHPKIHVEGKEKGWRAHDLHVERNL